MSLFLVQSTGLVFFATERLGMYDYEGSSKVTSGESIIKSFA